MNSVKAPIAIKSPAKGHHASGRARRRLVAGLLAFIAIGGAAAAYAVLSFRNSHHVVAGDPKASGHDPAPDQATIPVKAVHPKRDPSVEVTADQLGAVEPYYQADLRARASGLVRAVHKDIGDRVRRGDLLIEIDVPDADREVAQREAVVEQRHQELRVSQAKLKDAEAGREVAKAVIREKRALVEQTEATRDFRKKRLERLQRLAATDSVVAGVIDEENRDFAASQAAVTGSIAAVERSQADAAEAESKVEAAKADIDLKAALVEVSRRELDRSRAVAEYARVTAPFDGVIVRRNVDPGSFVQNATSGQSEPLISVARTDLVTVVARYTDQVAPFVTEGTEAQVYFPHLPGSAVRGRVTRYSPSIQNSDRTMRVEVDLFNGDAEDHRAIVRRLIGASVAPLTASHPLQWAAAEVLGQDALIGLHKGERDRFAVAALPATNRGAGRLIPGMTCNVKLSLRQFQSGYVLPATAVYSRSGKPYILVVEDGVTRQCPVQVQVNDGRVAKVTVLSRKRDAAGMIRDEAVELTGSEVVVAGRQIEVGEGARVKPAFTEW